MLPSGRPASRSHWEQQPVCGGEFLDAFELGQNDAVEPGADYGLKVAVSKWRGKCVDPAHSPAGDVEPVGP